MQKPGDTLSHVVSMGFSGMSRALMACVKRYVILAMLVTSCVLRLPSATLERLSLDDMITRSTTIVRGNVTASWAAFTGSVIYTHYQIQVSEQLRSEERRVGKECR